MYFNRIFPSAAEGRQHVNEAAVELKHLLSDMYSVVNFDELIQRIQDGLDPNNENDVKKVYFNWAAVQDNQIATERIGGRGSLRNILEHRYLVDIEVVRDPQHNGTNFAVFPEFANQFVLICPFIDTQAGGAPTNLSVRVLGILFATHSLLRSSL